MAAEYKRDKRTGKFVKGTKPPPGPGRPKRKVEEVYLRAVSAAVPIEAWHKIIQRAYVQALQGDARAREFLARYLAPPEQVVRLLDERRSEASEFVEQLLRKEGTVDAALAILRDRASSNGAGQSGGNGA